MTGVFTTRGKVLATAVLLILGAAFAGLGTFGTWTKAPTTSSPLNAAQLALGLGADGSANNRLTVGASNILPGDTMQRAITLTNTATDFAEIDLTVRAGSVTALTTDTTDGLHVTVSSCSGNWVEANAPNYTYTCSAGAGGITKIVNNQPIIQTNTDLGALNSLTSNGSDTLVVTVALPTTAPATMAGATTTLDFTFTGTVRSGTAK